MLNSGNDNNKPFSLVNAIEEQLNNISFNSSGFSLENEAEVLEETESTPAKNKNESLDVDKEIDVLSASEVRWFYKTAGKAWVEFSGWDTLQLEAAYRRLPLDFAELEREENEALEGRRDSQTARGPRNVLVRGGLYEVDIISRTCMSIYWPGEEFIVTRGMWFYETWQPLDDDLANIIESTHLSLFQGKKPSEITFDTNGKALHSDTIGEFNIDWYSLSEVYLYSQATSSKIVRSFVQKIGYFQKSTGSKLMRGYKYLATEEDKQTDIDHLVFVVHGIGQKMNIGAQIFRNTSLIRERVVSLKEKYFPDCKKRIEFFPVEWRSNLTLDGGTVEAITPLHIQMLRQLLNTSAMDIMYYTSPIYCAEIQEGLCMEMNRLYAMFKERNTSSRAKVSVIAHSLGAVIVYDIVTGWLPMGSNLDGHFIPGKSRLNFELDNMFCIGSPLSVFLAVRVPKAQQGYHLFPPSLCNRLYNIFHLTDPVAYRLEPLIVKEYARVSPLVIRPYNATNFVHYSEMPLEPLDPDLLPAVDPTTIKSEDSPTDTPTHKGEKKWRLWDFVRGGNKSLEGTCSPPSTESPVQGLEHRLDYVLTSGAVGPLMIRSVLISHTAYWTSLDVAFFLLTRIFPELEDQEMSRPEAATPPSPTPLY